MRRLSFIFGFLIVGSILSAQAWAQATAQISGTVKDPSGAVLPGVEITATQTQTGIVRTTVTNETGSYVLSNLAVGPYRFEASLPGFRTFVQTGIVLQVNGSPVINPVLEVGQVSEQVEVQANATLVETRNAGVEVRLVWRREADSLTLVVSDESTGEWFEVPVARDRALDAFYHPFAYADAA